MVLNNEIRFNVTQELQQEIQQLSEKIGLPYMQLARSLFVFGLQECKSKLVNGYDVLLQPEPVSRIPRIVYVKNKK